MSLSNQDANQLRTRLERNSNLSVTSKTNLNSFIEKKKNAFDRSTFMQQYNAKMRNLRNRDAGLGINSKRKRSRGNLNSAMENSTGSVSGGSVNPGKRGRNSPRGPLSAVSGASSISNNENVSSGSMNNNGYGGFSNNENGNGYGGFSNNENNLERNTKRRKNNSQAQAATNKAAANRAKANANARAAANKAKANANKAAANAKAKENYNKLRIKRNSLPRGLYNIFSNTILQNAVKQGRYQNMNTQINSKMKLANNNERRIKIQLNKIPNGNFRRNVQSKINNVRGNNSKTTALLQQINTEQKKINANAKAKAVRNRVPPMNLKAKAKAAAATQAAKNANANAARARANANAARARANANAAKNANANTAIANARVNVKINNLANIRDVVTLMLSKDQLIEIAKNLKVSYTKSNKVPKLKDTILKHNNKNDLIKEVNNQLVGDAESKKIAEKVNSYISGIRNIKSQTRPKYTASLVILYIKDLSKAARTNVIKNGRNLLQLMNGINSRTISNNNIKKEEKITNEEFTDLVFIMWLDGVHDKYITKTLDTWFNETTLFTKQQKALIVEGWNTPFIQIINSLKLPKNGAPNILKSSLENFSSGWERDVKTYLTEKYKKDAIPISTSLAQQVTSSIPQNINIGVDQEYTDNNENSITRFIQDHTRATNSKTDVNTLITYGQAFDPGRSMVSRGVHEDIEKLTLDKLLNNKFISKKKYYLCDMKIDLKVAAEDGRGETSVFKLQVQKDSSNNVNTLFNNKKILTGISARQAKNANGDIIAVSKYFGDALQYYSLAVMDNRTRTEKTERFFFGSGDSMALLGYDRVCEILKKSIRMVIDFPEKYGPKIHVVGMNGTVRNTPQPAYSTMTGAGVKNNNKNNAISK
uniref:Uncharacterized protein n=1 Tax=viral metagenome TaxID=1070528 RepID=A0A6C0IYT7_9ZZZZ